MSLAAGTRLGPYEVVAPLGAGGMGEVYRGRDSRLKRDIAIKIVPSPDPQRLRRFEQEAQAASRLNHPNILAVHDVGVHEGVPFLVTELLAGETLRDKLASTRLTVSQALTLAIQIARGLAAAHAQGIVHRDLKPENLFVTAAGTIKILDFGLAKLTQSLDPAAANAATVVPLTEHGVVMGTAGYMAPEQVQGLATDPRSDIFAFGAVLFEMLSGKRAFDRPTGAEAMTAILKDEPPDVAVANAAVPAALGQIVRQCLAKRPQDRLQSAEDLEGALAAVAPQAQSAVPAGLRRPYGRRATAVVAGLAVVGVAFLAAAFVAPDVFRIGPAAGVSDGLSHIRALVVLPLTNLSTDADQEFFSDGMTEALIADLARVGGWRVISRTSAMTYKAAKKPLPQIARELNVDAVVEGSVTRAGNRVRITAQLIDGITERHLWGNTYERDLRDVLALQSEVANAIANEIKITLTPQERALLASVRPLVPEAHEAYLRGRFVLAKGTEQAINQAIGYFKTAAVKDPAYAPPHAGIADAYTALRSVYAPPHVVMPLAKASAVRALELDPGLASAHVSMGGVMMFYDFDWAGAERELRQAIALSPNLAEAHDYYALYLAVQGRHADAVGESTLARALDPMSLVILNNAGWVHYLGGDFARTIEMNQKALDLDRNFWPALRDLGLGYEKVGRFPEAIATLDRARALDANPSILEMLAGAYAAWGKKDEARKVLVDLEAQAARQYVCPYEVATVYAGLGDKNSTMTWLEKGLHERADCMPWAHADSKLHAMRGDPRFDDLMRRMRIPIH